MYQLVLFIHLILSISLVGLVLLQRGKGASMGAAFGSGASGTVFGSQGASSFLVKVTAALGAGFFATSLTLGYIAAKQYRSAQAVTIPVPVQQQQQVPTLEQEPSTLNDNGGEAAP